MDMVPIFQETSCSTSHPKKLHIPPMLAWEPTQMKKRGALIMKAVMNRTAP